MRTSADTCRTSAVGCDAPAGGLTTTRVACYKCGENVCKNYGATGAKCTAPAQARKRWCAEHAQFVEAARMASRTALTDDVGAFVKKRNKRRG